MTKWKELALELATTGKELARQIRQLEAELEERTHQYHLAPAKILSREAIIEQLSESELVKGVAKLEAENNSLRQLHTAQMEENEMLREENERLAETINSWIEDGEMVPTTRVSIPIGVLRLWRDALKEGEGWETNCTIG